MSIASGFAGLVLIILLGLMVGAFAFGIFLIVRSRRGGLGFPACGACQYDLTGSIGTATKCPECGVDVAEAGIIPPGGRRSVGRVAFGVVLLVFSLTCVSGMLAPLLFAASRATSVVAPAAPPSPAASPVGDGSGEPMPE